MGLTRKQKKHADALKAALDKYDGEKDSQDAVRTAKELGDAAKAGDEKKLGELADKARRKGWLK